MVYVSPNQSMVDNTQEHTAYFNSMTKISSEFGLVTNPNDFHHIHVSWVKPEDVDRTLKVESKHAVILVGCHSSLITSATRILTGRGYNIRYFEDNPYPCIVNYITHSLAYASMAEASIRLKQYNYTNQVYSGFDMYKDLKYGKKKLFKNVSVSVESLESENYQDLKDYLGGTEIKPDMATIHVDFTDTKPDDDPDVYHIHIRDLYSTKMEETTYHTYIYTDVVRARSSIQNLASMIRLGVDGLNANLVLARPTSRFTQRELEASLKLLDDQYK